MNEHMSDIYPKELELKHENSRNDQHTTYLDLEMNVVNNEIVTSLYDKRDDFPFTVVNFPDLSGNIPQDSSYGVFIAQTLVTHEHVPCIMTSCYEHTDYVHNS